MRQIGTALRETLRRRDVAGRLGGDDFAVVLPRTRLADSALVVSRIISRLDDRQVAPRITRVALNVGSIQMHAERDDRRSAAPRRGGARHQRDEARRGDTGAVRARGRASGDRAARSLAPTPSALMSLIPVGEVTLRR